MIEQLLRSPGMPGRRAARDPGAASGARVAYKRPRCGRLPAPSVGVGPSAAPRGGAARLALGRASPLRWIVPGRPTKGGAAAGRSASSLEDLGHHAGAHGLAPLADGE